MKTRQIHCLPKPRAASGVTADWLPLTKERGVKLFSMGYTKAHVVKEARIMAKAARLGLGPQVYSVVFVKELGKRRWGIEVEIANILDYGDISMDDQALVDIRRRIRKTMRLINADVRPENIGMARGKLVVTDWTLARLVPVERMTSKMKRHYAKKPLNESATTRASLCPHDFNIAGY